MRTVPRAWAVEIAGDRVELRLEGGRDPQLLSILQARSLALALQRQAAEASRLAEARRDAEVMFSLR